MFKKILKCCTVLLLGMVVTACYMNVGGYPYGYHHHECYHYANGTVDWYRYYY